MRSGWNRSGGKDMSRGSTIYTIGTALNGFGVVLESSPQEHSVVRVESITAVTIRSRAPRHEQIPERAYAMPGRPGLS